MTAIAVDDVYAAGAVGAENGLHLGSAQIERIGIVGQDDSVSALVAYLYRLVSRYVVVGIAQRYLWVGTLHPYHPFGGGHLEDDVVELLEVGQVDESVILGADECIGRSHARFCQHGLHQIGQCLAGCCRGIIR